MNNKDFTTLVEQTQRDTLSLLVSKGQEYAGTEDRLSNFKRGAQLTGTTPLQTCFVYMSKHYDSLATYVRKDAAGFSQTLSEPIEGRLDDLINYCVLMKAIISEAAQDDSKKVDKAIPLVTTSDRYVPYKAKKGPAYSLDT